MKKILFIILLSFVFQSCSTEDDSPNDTTDANIWSGATVSFSKPDGGDPELPANQDRLTSNVWITRDNNNDPNKGGGQIYNIAKESVANKQTSPAETEWAIGNISQLSTLSFKNFRTAVGSPQDIVGKNLVLHLKVEDIYLSVKFTSWSRDGKGGFAYERSSP